MLIIKKQRDRKWKKGRMTFLNNKNRLKEKRKSQINLRKKAIKRKCKPVSLQNQGSGRPKQRNKKWRKRRSS